MKKTKKTKTKTKKLKIGKFELASQDQVNKMDRYVDIVIRALGFPRSLVLVTDESYISDFITFLESEERKKDFEKFRKKMKKMGVDVEFNDSVVDVAKRLMEILE